MPTTVTVTSASGDAAVAGSLPNLIAQSNSHGGYTIQFSSLFNTPQTINLTSQLNVTAPLDIQGPGADLLTITPATGNNRLFNIPSGTNPTTISGVTLSNTTGSTAVAIFDNNSNLTILRSVITGFNNTNSNSYQGGAIELLTPATLTIGYSTIAGNSTTGHGGGVAVTNGGTENIYESTITGNTATGTLGGGGLYFWGHNTATIKNSTIVGNNAPNSTHGGGISEVNFSGSTLTLSSTIVAQNTDQSAAAPDINQDGTSTLTVNYSLIGSTAGTSAITGSNNKLNVSPGFTSFAPTNNGGPTPTLALPAGSPALASGAANGFANDQRGPGFPRTLNGATDIGAFQTQPVPTVTGLSSHSGPLGGGTSVVITGTGFTSATAVMFGRIPVTSFVVDSDTQITATAPAGPAGTINVRVTTAGGTTAASTADQYTYIAAPTVTGLSPSSGPSGGGASIVITGTGFTGVTAVKFGSTAATSFHVDSDTQITAISPAGSGTVDVSVLTPFGSSATSSADKFTFTVTPPLPPSPPPAPPSLTVPFPLSLAVFLSNQTLGNQLSLALSWQTLISQPMADAHLIQAFATATLWDPPLATELDHLASDLALFANAPLNFSSSSPLTWLLAADVVSTSSEIASHPLFHTPDGYVESAQFLALELHYLTAPHNSSQAGIAALQQTLLQQMSNMESLFESLLRR